MKHLLFFLLFAPLSVHAQITTDAWRLFKTNDYYISYPDNWRLDTSGQMGTRLIIFAPSEGGKNLFQVNINLIIQDVKEYKLDLDGYAKLSTDQIKTMISNSKIIENKRVKQGHFEYQKVIYKGDLQSYHLTFEQYYTVYNGLAYVVTFTSEQSEFKKYKQAAEKILDSFALTAVKK